MLGHYRLALGGAVLTGVLSTGASLGQPLTIGWAVGRIVGHHSVRFPFILLATLFVGEGLLNAVQAYLLGRVGSAVVLDVRRMLVSRLLRASVASHLSRQRGDLFSTAVADTSLMGSLLPQSLVTLLTSTVMILGSVAFMAYLDAVLTGVILACVSLASVTTFVLARRLRVASQDSRDRVGEFGSALQRAIVALRTVKVSRAEGREEARIDSFAADSFRASMRVARINALMVTTMGLGVQGAFAGVFTVGAFRLAGGELSTASFSAYLLYVLYLLAPLMNFYQGVAQFQQCVASATRVTDMVDGVEVEVDLQPEPAQAPVPLPARRATLLEFAEVGFHYRRDAAVLRDLSFGIDSQGVTAIVGPSGAGKSTLFALIERFWDVDAGVISLDGINIADMSLTDLRRRVGCVDQDAVVLDGTVRENLLYANPDALPDELAEAIDLASLDAWLRRLPSGLDTPVGESGAAISGGERQRIAIARALLAKPELLLLDEATSQLDAEAERALRTTIQRVSRRCAVLTIAHQMSMAASADRILLIEDGRLRADGTHEALLGSDDLYRRLAAGQILGTVDAASPSPRTPGSSDRPGLGRLAETVGDRA